MHVCVIIHTYSSIHPQTITYVCSSQPDDLHARKSLKWWDVACAAADLLWNLSKVVLSKYIEMASDRY